MKAFEIKKDKDVDGYEELPKILRVFSHLDKIRWSEEKNNYNTINYCDDELSEDGKLLTHWLCYIMERQTPYQRIWDIAGFVVSNIVKDYEDKKDIIFEQGVEGTYTKYTEDKLRLTVKVNNELDEMQVKRLERHDVIFKDGVITFASRFPADDFARIYRTLLILDKGYGRSFSRYINEAIGESKKPDRDTIERVASWLNYLSYAPAPKEIGRIKVGKDAIDYVETINAIKKEIMNSDKLQPAKSKIEKSDIFKRKRLWCSLRDYLKSPEFNVNFVKGLKESGYNYAEEWRYPNVDLKKALIALELPGDVWNNRPIFREGLFSPYLDNDTSWSMPRIIREIYNDLSKCNGCDLEGLYPEQLDVTFDFVPRMCENSLCDVCFFGKGIDKVCHKIKDKLCPVVLYSCGYKFKCIPEECELKQDNYAGICKNKLLSENSM